MRLRAVLMVKSPEAGAAKTRLAESGGFSNDEIRSLAWAMLECSARRLAARFNLTLAVSPDGSGDSMLARLSDVDFECVDQGPGDLGERLDRVWKRVATTEPVAFFGADTPDLPAGHLDSIPTMFDRHEIAIGPTDDGGFWTLAARRYAPGLLERIDWGTPAVYDQTRDRAVAAGLDLGVLTPWQDIDQAADLIHLRARLARWRESRSDAYDQHLEALHRVIDNHARS